MAAAYDDIDEFFRQLDVEQRRWQYRAQRPFRRAWHWANPRELRRRVRWGIQRWRRGYSDCDVWNLDHHLAAIIPPAMRQLASGLHGVPGYLVGECGSMEAAEVEWRRIILAVADGFEAWTVRDDEHPEGERLVELTRAWEEGSALLLRHFGAFWD